MSIQFRRARPDDAETAGRICFDAFSAIAARHGYPSDVPALEMGVGLAKALIGRSDIYAVIAERDGSIIGSNFMWEMSSIFGIGPITVDPHVQNKGAGGALMKDVLDRALERKAAGVRLVQAAYHCRSLSLYTKLGFDTREPLSVMQGPVLKATIAGHAVRAATEGDVAACNALSDRVHGFSRGIELRDGIREGTATVVEHDGRISGYATSIGFFGHATCESNQDLKALIGAAPVFAAQGFVLPTRNADVFRWCLDRGLRVVAPMTLMSLGLYNEPAGAFMPSIIF